MPSYIQNLIDNNLISPPKWLRDNLMFEGITGSVSYEVSDLDSDVDLVGFCIPPRDLVFPHLAGEIFGFGTQIKRFDVYQEHHIKFNNKEYDICVYSIVKFFQLAMENNPNLIDNLFLKRKFVTHSTAIYEHLRDNRRIFLHKGSWHKFRGYAYSSLSKIKTKNHSIISNILQKYKLSSTPTLEEIEHELYIRRLNK